MQSYKDFFAPKIATSGNVGLAIEFESVIQCCIYRRSIVGCLSSGKRKKHPAHPLSLSLTTAPPCVRRIALPISSSSTGLPASLSQKAERKL